MTTKNQFNNHSHHVFLLVETASIEQMKVPVRSASPVSKSKRSQLGSDFEPSRFSVICGRGKESYDHVGNHHFRELASMFVARYSRAGSKADKSEIVSDMVGIIHQADGIFCKFETGAWYKVGDHYAREKAGALLRDMVQTQQSSSPVVKVKKAKKTKAKAVRPTIQKQSKAQNQQDGHQQVDGTTGHANDSTLRQLQAQYGQLLVEYDTVFGHLDDSTPQTHQCGEHEKLVEGVPAGVEQSDDSAVSTLSHWGEDPLGFDENGLEDEDGFSDVFVAELCCIFGIPSLLL